MRILDLTGHRSGRLVVLGRAPTGVSADGGRYGRWNVACDCGATTVVSTDNLRGRRPTRSCGCLVREVNAELRRIHGHAARRTGKRSREYRTWEAMNRRCSATSDAFRNYGGRGIRVCDAWSSFETFLVDMGPAPTRGTIERKNNNGNYEPGNCRWATYREQANNRRSNFIITANGETRTSAEWSRIVGIGASCIRKRIKRGWSAEAALGLASASASEAA